MSLRIFVANIVMGGLYIFFAAGAAFSIAHGLRTHEFMYIAIGLTAFITAIGCLVCVPVDDDDDE